MASYLNDSHRFKLIKICNYKFKSAGNAACFLVWTNKYMPCILKRQAMPPRLFNRLINNGTGGRGMPTCPEFFFRSKEYEIQKDIERQKYRKGKLKNVSEEGRHLHTPAFGDRFHHKVGAVAYVGHCSEEHGTDGYGLQ